MAEREAGKERWRPTATNLVAGGMVIAGFLLTSWSWWFFLLAAAGTFGPGLLRELGWLNDRDEFQRQADHRAGYHAFLMVGMVAFFLVAFFRSGERTIEHLERLATLFLALLWFTWFLSSLLAYWGPKKTATRVLYSFGAVWLLFAILSNLGSEWTGWTALLLQPLLAVPFFVLGWLAGRAPRVAGVLLLAVAVYLFFFLGGFKRGGAGLITESVTFIFFLGPLLASGVVLMGAKREDLADDEGDEAS